VKTLLSALFVALVALVAAPEAAAQTPVNPTAVTFDSPDHAQVTRYGVGYFLGTATTPFQEVSVPVAQVSGSAAAGRSLLLARPAFGNFTVKLRAVGLDANSAEVSSPWSAASVPFVFSPLAPTVRGVQ
jgi:hypothetical protein